MDISVIIFLTSGLFLGWALGANDAANVFGTAVGTRMVRFSTAAIICSIFVVLGAVNSGAGAAHTLGKLGTIDSLAGAFMAAFSAALAEMMADVVEYKLLKAHPGQRDAMPSSSFFKLFPSKLDLTLQDVTRYFEQATEVFRRWAAEPERRRRTCDELVQRGATRPAAEAAVQQALGEWETLARSFYAPQLWWEAAPGGHLRVNAFTRIALNFLGIHRAVVETYRRIEDVPVGTLPLESFKDLLVIGASVFFEADRPRNLWRVDEYLSLRFLPLCRRLGLGRCGSNPRQ